MDERAILSPCWCLPAAIFVPFPSMCNNRSVRFTPAAMTASWQVANGLKGRQIPASTVRHMRGHKLTPTCVALSPDDASAFSGSKDNSIVRWDVETGKRFTMLPQWRKAQKGKISEVKAHSKEVPRPASTAQTQRVVVVFQIGTFQFPRLGLEKPLACAY